MQGSKYYSYFGNFNDDEMAKRINNSGFNLTARTGAIYGTRKKNKQKKKKIELLCLLYFFKVYLVCTNFFIHLYFYHRLFFH